MNTPSPNDDTQALRELAAADGRLMHRWATDLFPICRSVTGNGVRQTLRYLQELLPELSVHEVPSGTAVLDWTIPDEWNITDAYVLDGRGTRVIDFQQHNLHVVGYSEPVDIELDLEELQDHLHSLPEQPDAIPYVTSYYQRRWGFCLTHQQRESLRPGRYRAVVQSTLAPGALTYGELFIPGETEREVFLSTYICHPSMANNELSGPVVLTRLAQWLQSRPRRLTYRLVFIPETIGAITYLDRHLDTLKRNVEVGFNLSCLGDEGDYSFVASRYGDTLADRVAAHVLRHIHPDAHTEFSFLQRGSDERQYCSPGVDLPLVTLCRSKFGEYPEYHTSLDDLELVTPNGLAGGLDFVRRCIEVAEINRRYLVTCHGEPQLGKRGLYPTISAKGSTAPTKLMMNVIAYADGRNDLLAISERLSRPVWELTEIAATLHQAGLLQDLGDGGY